MLKDRSDFNGTSNSSFAHGTLWGKMLKSASSIITEVEIRFKT